MGRRIRVSFDRPLLAVYPRDATDVRAVRQSLPGRRFSTRYGRSFNYAETLTTMNASVGHVLDGAIWARRV